MRLEINVKPNRTARLARYGGLSDEFGGDAPVPIVSMYAGVEDRSMDASVPGDVNETDELFPAVGADVTKAPLEDGVPALTTFLTPSVQPKTFHFSLVWPLVYFVLNFLHASAY